VLHGGFSGGTDDPTTDGEEMNFVPTESARQSRKEREARLKELREALGSNYCAAIHLKLEQGWTDLNDGVWVQVPRRRAIELVEGIPEDTNAPVFSKKFPAIEDAKTYSLYVSAPSRPGDDSRDERETSALETGTG
jgi:hypothetical protein